MMSKVHSMHQICELNQDSEKLGKNRDRAKIYRYKRLTSPRYLNPHDPPAAWKESIGRIAESCWGFRNGPFLDEKQ
jgi:hypothetical protein